MSKEQIKRNYKEEI